MGMAFEGRDAPAGKDAGRSAGFSSLQPATRQETQNESLQMLNNPSGPSAGVAPGSGKRGWDEGRKASFLDHQRQAQHSKDIGEAPYDRGQGTYHEYMGR